MQGSPQGSPFSKFLLCLLLDIHSGQLDLCHQNYAEFGWLPKSIESPPLLPTSSSIFAVKYSHVFPIMLHVRLSIEFPDNNNYAAQSSVVEHGSLRCGSVQRLMLCGFFSPPTQYPKYMTCLRCSSEVVKIYIKAMKLYVILLI